MVTSHADQGATGAYDRYRAASHFPALDGMRALAVTAVVWEHVVDPAGRWGIFGVSLFFVISGFLITTLLLRERERAGRIDLRAFYARRALRIFPLYYAVLALYTVLVTAAEPTSAAAREFYANLPAFATYTSNWFVDYSEGTRTIFLFAWSLATEEQFYLVWPLVLVAAGRDWRWPVAVAVLLLVAQLVTQFAVERGVLTRGLPTRIVVSIAPAICLGCVAAYAAHGRRSFGVLTKGIGGALTRRGAAFTLLAACAALKLAGAPEFVVVVGFAFVVLAACLAAGGEGAEGAPARPADAGWLAWAPLRAAGAVSYGIYLLHLLAAHIARRLLWPDAPTLVLFAATLVVALLLAALSYHTFERRFLRLRDRFRGGGAAPAVPAPPARSATVPAARMTARYPDVLTESAR